MGKLIVIEGIDGSGKSTQYKKLRQRLESEGRNFRSLVFPRYDNPSSALIRMYLGGEFGSDPGDVNAFAASSFYSVDRYASYKTEWEQYYREGGVLLSDRYTTSNAVHQASKLPEGERREYLDWLFGLEYGRLGLPEPDLVLYLDMPTEITERMMRQREEATGTHADIHEQDEVYLKNCRANAREIAKECGWSVINCARDGGPRTPEDIHQQVYRLVKKLL